MRHQRAYRRFSITAAHRRAFFRNMVTSLLREEKFETTIERAKDLKRIAERMITLGKKESLHARRQAYAYLLNKQVVHKLFGELGPRYRARPGGYTRVIRSGFRHGDSAQLAVVQLVKNETEKSSAPAATEAKAEK